MAHRGNRILICVGVTLAASALGWGAVGLSEGTFSVPRVDAVDWADPDAAKVQAIGKALAGNEELRDALARHLRQAPDLARKFSMAQLLTTHAEPAALDLARRWVASEDAGERADGFVLWLALPPSEEALALARQTIDRERDPTALGLAVSALRPVLQPSRAEARSVLPVLERLAAHDAPLPRAHAIQKLAEWDLDGSLSEPVVLKGLADADATVRQAAIGAAMIGSLRSDPLRSALLAVLRNAQEAVSLRFSAAHALERIPLEPAQHELYVAARKALEVPVVGR